MSRIPRVIIHEDMPTINIVTPYEDDLTSDDYTEYLGDEITKELLQEVGSGGFILFSYYVGKQDIPDFLFTDERASKDLGIPIKKIAYIRRKLIKAGWFLQYNEYFDKKTNEYVIRTILGKDNIIKYMKNKSTREDNLKEMFG